MMSAFLLTLALKGAVVLVLGATVAWLLRRAPASLRHGVWAATFAVLLAVPVLDAVGPAWRVGMLPSTASISTEAPLASPATTPTPERAAPLASITPATSENGGEPATMATPIVARPAAHVSTADRLVETIRGASLAAWLGGLWALGVLVVALVWLRAFALARRLVREAHPIAEPEWAARAEHAARKSGLEAPVRLLRSDALSVPIAWGFGRMAVLLPPQSEGWDAERAEAVLLHEMAHLRRRDAWTQVIAQAALALHWPNPLAWLAYRWFLTAREQACDDAVLGVGAPPTTYASHLVAAARELSPSRLTLAAVPPLIGPDELETRVRAILDGQRRRGPVGRWTTGAALGLAVAVGGPLAAFQPVPMSDRTAPMAAQQIATPIETGGASEPEVDGSGARTRADREAGAPEPSDSDRQPVPDVPEALAEAAIVRLPTTRLAVPDTTDRETEGTRRAGSPSAADGTPVSSLRAGNATITTRYGDPSTSLPAGAIAITTTFGRPSTVDEQTHDAIMYRIRADITAEIVAELGSDMTPERFRDLYLRYAEGIPDRYNALLLASREYGQAPTGLRPYEHRYVSIDDRPRPSRESPRRFPNTRT